MVKIKKVKCENKPSLCKPVATRFPYLDDDATFLELVLFPLRHSNSSI